MVRLAAGVLTTALAAAGLAAQAPRLNDATDRAALVALVAAVDAAQARTDDDDGAFAWTHHVLKSVDHTAFVPFRVFPPDGFKSSKNGLMYVRAVSRHDIRKAADIHHRKVSVFSRPNSTPP